MDQPRTPTRATATRRRRRRPAARANTAGRPSARSAVRPQRGEPGSSGSSSRPPPTKRGRRLPAAAAPPRRRPLWRWLALALLGGLVVAGVAWTMGLVRFAAKIPDTIADATTPADAIVVLTGGSERVATGIRLLAESKGTRVFISGVHPGVPIEDLLRVAGVAAEEDDPRIETGHGARDTAGNAEETAAWMRDHGYRSLRLVTGSYHMPRSLLEFAHALPEARVIPNPVFPNSVHQDQWWRSPGTAALIISEYTKFLFAMARHQVVPWVPEMLTAAWVGRPVICAAGPATRPAPAPAPAASAPADFAPAAGPAADDTPRARPSASERSWPDVLWSEVRRVGDRWLGRC